MKIKSIAAVGALSAGLGIAGFIGAGVSSAAPTESCESTTPAFTPARAACVAGENVAIFGNTTNPAYQLDQLLSSGEDSNGNAVGLTHWGSTFQSSVGDFLNGPRAPEDPTAPAAP